jgi:hypothetical protein
VLGHLVSFILKAQGFPQTTSLYITHTQRLRLRLLWRFLYVFTATRGGIQRDRIDPRCLSPIILDHAIPLDSSFGGFYSINGFQWRCSTLPSRASSTPATSTWLEKENSIIPTDQVSHSYMLVCVSVSDFSFKTKYNRVAASPCSLSLPLAGTCMFH